ncbi:MAG: tetratricopeptide repeat protein [Anaerolineae bacterium]|nr:tetratricopeptide repeat protein [Anaerolineae bacterium]
MTEIKGERREVTVLFFDIKDFTSTARNMDSEEVYLIVDQTMRSLAEIIHRFDGTIDKFTGDGLMAVFGAPVMHEDDPVRAVSAALEMQRTMCDLARQWADVAEVKGRIGINTGPVVAGQVGNDHHLEYTVIGDTVNLASRLESAAQPATVLVSYATYLRTNHIFDYEVLPPIQVKGIGEPVWTARPVAVVAQRQRSRGFEGTKFPLVGRMEALQNLSQVLSEVNANAGARVAFISGGAGYGKSRLVEELSKLEVAIPFNWIEGRCLSYSQSQPYRLVADLLRNLCHIQEADPPERQSTKLYECMQRLNLSDSGISPYLEYILNIDTDDPTDRVTPTLSEPRLVNRPIHRAIMQVLTSEARVSPTVYVFEDLQWVDPGSLEFLGFLLQNCDDLHSLIVLISRDHERITQLKGLVDIAQRMSKRVLDLRLELLPGRETEQLVDLLITGVGNSAREVKRWIAQKSLGNPFYVEELARMLADRGGLVGQPGTWEVTAKATHLLDGVPNSVKGVILSRFDRLGKPARLLLDIAAVAGAKFPVRILVELSGMSIESVQLGLEELQRLRFLRAVPDLHSNWYVFEHTLTQEAIYDTLLKRDRQRLHRQIADAIDAADSWPTDNRSELLAMHLSKCDTPARAIPYLLTLAKNAAEHGTYGSAVEYYRQAIQLIDDYGGLDIGQWCETEMAFAQALKYVGEFVESAQILTDVVATASDEQAELTSNQRSLLQINALRELSDISTREGSYEKAIMYLDLAADALDAVDLRQHEELVSTLEDRRAWILFRQGALTESVALASRLLVETQAKDDYDPLLLASICNTLGGVSWQQGRFQTAVEYVQESLALFRAANNSWGVAVAFSNLGVLHDILGHWGVAAKYYHQASKMQEKLGDLEHQACSLDNLGALRTAMGEFLTARQDLEQSKEIRARLGDSLGLAQSYASLAQLELAEGRLAEAEDHAQAALLLAETIGSEQSCIFAGWLLADTYLRQDRLPEADLTAAAALQLAHQNGCTEQIPDCLRVLGNVHQRRGNHDSAIHLYRQAVEVAVNQGDPYRHGLALKQLGELHRSLLHREVGSPESQEQEANSALYSAKLLFEKLGASHDLAIVKQALAEIGNDMSGSLAPEGIA